MDFAERGWRRVGRCLIWAAVSWSCTGDSSVQAPIRSSLTSGVEATVSQVDGIETWQYPSDALQLAPQFTIDPTPEAVFGGAEGDAAYDLTYVRTATILDDARVATVSPIGARLFLFAADGRPERIIGRQGQGPGEFMRPSGPFRAGGDSLLVIDDANLQISWILPDKGVVAQRRLEPDLSDQLHQAIGVLSNGMIVMSGAGLFQTGEADRITRPPAAVGVVSPRNGTTRVVASIPDLQMTMFETRYRGRAQLMSMPLRLGEAAQVAAWDPLIVTTGEGTILELRDSVGGVVRHLHLPMTRRPVTEAMRRQVIDRELMSLRGAQEGRMVDPAESERIAREWPFADSLPLVGQLLVGSDKLLWVVDPAVPGDAAWGATAIASSGTIVARVTGEGGMPMAFGPDLVLLKREDADGVVTLTKHRLLPR